MTGRTRGCWNGNPSNCLPRCERLQVQRDEVAAHAAGQEAAVQRQRKVVGYLLLQFFEDNPNDRMPDEKQRAEAELLRRVTDLVSDGRATAATTLEVFGEWYGYQRWTARSSTVPRLRCSRLPLDAGRRLDPRRSLIPRWLMLLPDYISNRGRIPKPFVRGPVLAPVQGRCNFLGRSPDIELNRRCHS